jgi:hypothetical protein
MIFAVTGLFMFGYLVGWGTSASRSDFQRLCVSSCVTAGQRGLVRRGNGSRLQIARALAGDIAGVECESATEAPSEIDRQTYLDRAARKRSSEPCRLVSISFCGSLLVLSADKCETKESRRLASP